MKPQKRFKTDLIKVLEAVKEVSKRALPMIVRLYGHQITEAIMEWIKAALDTWKDT